MKPDPKLHKRAGSLSFRSPDESAPAGVVTMSVSSEAPVLSEVYFNEQWQRVYEVLDHSPESVDMARCKDGLVILDRHGGDQVGLMQVAIRDRKIGGAVEFCAGERAQEIAADAAKGLRRNVSVGYQVDPASYRLEGEKDGIPVVRAMSWMPYEASFEPVPADITVGVGRAADPAKIVVTAPTPKKENRVMEPKEVAKLFERAAAHGIAAPQVRELIEAGKGAAELDALIVESQRAEIATLKTRKPEAPPVSGSVPVIGGSERAEAAVAKRYSLINVVRAAAGMKVDIGFEREISDECRRLGMGGSKRGGTMTVPHAVLAKRDFTKAGTSSYSVATNLLPGEFIELLRTKTVLAPLGVRFLSGLVGDVAIPKMTAGATGYWVTEGNDITESAPTLGQVTGTPHTAGALVDISRRLLNQSTPDAEMLARDEMVERVARTIQIAVFQGTGADGQPSAITAASGINNPSVTQGTPTYLELLGFPGLIMADNAEVDGQQWVMTAEVWQKLAGTFTDGTAKAERVLDFNSKTCLGFPYHVSEDVGANSLFFGYWPTVTVGVWGAGIDINVDTATLSASGGVRLVALQDVDVMVRLGQALAYNSAVTA